MAVALLAVLGAASAVASHSFLDVPEDHLFHGDIEWMKDTGVTRGCNPPANTNYCPEDYTTRGEMAAFFHRFSTSGVLNAGTLDGLDSTDFLGKDEKAADSDLLDGKDSTEFLTKAEAAELGGVPGPQGPAGEPGSVASGVVIREASVGSGLIAVGNTYTAMCEAGEVAIGGGYEANFALVDLAGVTLPILGDLSGLLSIDLGDLDAALDGVSSVSVSASTPVQDGSLFGWQIHATADIVNDITVRVVCAS